MKKFTKIVATIGPASDSEEKIESLMQAGVNVFRFNMKHNTIDWHQERIARVQSIADR
jgi:pyruvate kinase